MNYREALIEDSVRQFSGNIPDEVIGICVKFNSEFDAKYLIFSSVLNDEIDSIVLEAIQDILVNGGARKDSFGNIGWIFEINYEILTSFDKIQEEIENSDFVWIYTKDSGFCL